MEYQTLLQKLNSLIEEFAKKTDYPPTQIHMGYRTYAKLMQCPPFAEEVTNSALVLNKRKYKKIKIKITKDDNQLELE